MKKYLISLIAVVAFALSASSQVQLQLGYGGYTQMDATDMHDGGPSINNAWGALTAGVNVKVAPKFYLGGSYTFSSASRKHIDDSSAYYHVLMLNGRYEYWKNSIVKLYGHLGMGVDISHMTYGDYSDNKAYFAFQVSPLGAEVDLTRVTTIFGELGFGAQGLLQVGVRLNL